MLAAMIALAGALLNIVGIMVFAFGRGGGSSPELADARSRMTQQEMLRVVEALEAYHATEHAYPPSLMALQRSAVSRRFLIILDNSSGPLHFPHEFRYVLAPGGESYDLVATGPDNVIGTADDIRPALPDSLKATSGLRPAAAGGPP
jgi:hypothetical protein